jgi:hypothetical protein
MFGCGNIGLAWAAGCRWRGEPVSKAHQRQLHIMTGAERLYNQGQPLAQRDLDSMIGHDPLCPQNMLVG